MQRSPRMQKLLFLSRLAFICNIFFLLAVSIQQSNWISNPDISSLVATLGYFMALVINPLVNLLYLFLLILKKRFWKGLPLWLIAANGLFLVLQVVYIFYINDTRYS